jgi:thiol-disulfide isomerase/thioredoxin
VSSNHSNDTSRKWVNRAAFAAVVLVGCLAILAGNRSSSSAAMRVRLERSQEAAAAFKHPFDDLVGKPAPALALQTIDGKKMFLSGFPGSTVLFFFSLDYCPPCQEELSALRRVLEESPGQVRIIGIARQLSGRGAPETEFVTRLQHLEAGFPVALDDPALDRLFGNIKVVPSTIYIDSSGTITRQSLSQSYEDLRKSLPAR